PPPWPLGLRALTGSGPRVTELLCEGADRLPQRVEPTEEEVIGALDDARAGPGQTGGEGPEGVERAVRIARACRQQERARLEPGEPPEVVHAERWRDQGEPPHRLVLTAHQGCHPGAEGVAEDPERASPCHPSQNAERGADVILLLLASAVAPARRPDSPEIEPQG